MEEFAASLAYFLIFGAFAGLILPDTKYRKYVEICLGFVFIIMMLNPITKLINTRQPPINQLFEGLDKRLNDIEIPGDLAEYEQKNRDMLLKSFNEQLTAQLAGFCGDENYEIIDAQARLADDWSIERLDITVRPKTTERPFIYIEPVKPFAANDDIDDPGISKIKNNVSDFYGVHINNIYITVTK
ncbi:MAG: stage III sporulation protein AF [Clostridiales bacterium]|jgi:stage III sporulation protein AF|nr:stage III sporulation protein AF [Clostridiales bacterium]